MEEDKNLPETEPELDLDAIMREFGVEPESEPLEEAATQPEIPAPEPEEDPDAKIWTPAQSKEPEVPSDTIRLDKIQEAVQPAEDPVGDETAVFAPVSEISDDTAVFSLEDDTMVFRPAQADDFDDTRIHAPVKEFVEPFSENWEPDYDEPMGNFQPPQPIVFRPKNRLRELRQQLVAGPEQRYYALSEIGVGKLQASILLGILLFILCAGATVLYAMNMVAADRIRLVIFWQGLALLLSGLLGVYRLMEGVGDIFRGRFTLNTLLAFTFAACIADVVVCLRSQTLPCCALFCLEIVMAQFGELHRRSAEMSMMDTLRKATNLYSVVRIPDLHEGTQGYGSAEGKVEDFMDNYNKTAAPELVLHIYALVALVASIALGIVTGMRFGTASGIRAATAALLIAVPATGFVSMSRPMAILQKRLHKLGAVLCGWQGIKGEKKSALFPISHEDLFPAGSVKFNGVKFYGYMNPDTVVAYAASLMTEDENALSPLFDQLLAGRNGFHFHVDAFRTYESGGIGGEIGGESVLAGSLRFMREMGVEMPEGTRVAQAVYLAVEGSLCGVFALAYGKPKNGAAGLKTLCGYRKLVPVLVSSDVNLTESFLRAKFKVNTRRMMFPAPETRAAIAKKAAPEEATVVAMTVKEGLAQRSFAITGARTLRASLRSGAAVHLLGGILGLLMVGTLAWVGATNLLTSENLLLYSAIWMVPGWLVTEWTRHL